MFIAPLFIRYGPSLGVQPPIIYGTCISWSIIHLLRSMKLCHLYHSEISHTQTNIACFHSYVVNNTKK
jgi:hypothetical protein